MIEPITIEEIRLYSDSLVALNWLRSYAAKLKIFSSKHSVFVKNQLEKISEILGNQRISFYFISGTDNPADCTTRMVSYRAFIRSNYLSGASLKNLNLESNALSFVLPIENGSLFEVNTLCSQQDIFVSLPISLDKFSHFSHLIRVYSKLFQFINCLKRSLRNKDSFKFGHLEIYPAETNFINLAKIFIIKSDQRKHYPDVFDYFKSKPHIIGKIPNIVLHLNLFLDSEGILRVRNKSQKGNNQSLCYSPIFVPRSGELLKPLIRDIHENNSHVGKYQVLNEFRKEYWRSRMFSAVQSILLQCLKCKKLNARKIKLNQNAYRDFRINPSEIPFRFIFLDHFGPYSVSWEGKRVKCWILIITCLWSRAVNLKVCTDLSVETFLKALQLHIFEFGVPERIFSDLGSSFKPAADTIVSFLNDVETVTFLQEKNISLPEFQQYFKGNSSLGSLVEILVKSSKKLISNTLGKKLLNFIDFDFLINQIRFLMNRRPIAFKEALRDCNPNQDVPESITHEMLLTGTEIVVVNIIP